MAIISLMSACSESTDEREKITFTWKFKSGISTSSKPVSQSSKGFEELMKKYPNSNEAVCKNGKNANDDTIKKCVGRYLKKISNAIKKMNGRMGKFDHYTIFPVTDWGECKAFLYIHNVSNGHRISAFSTIVFLLGLLVLI